jgi:hypothetical protein
MVYTSGSKPKLVIGLGRNGSYHRTYTYARLIIAAKILRTSLWNSWPLQNIYISNGKESFTLCIELLFPLSSARFLQNLTIQVTLLTLHEHIGSYPIITDYTSNTIMGDEPMCSWRVSSVTCIVCNNGVWTNVFVKGKQCYLYSL